VSRIRNSARFYQPAREVSRVSSIGDVDTRWTSPSSLRGGTKTNGFLCSFSNLPEKNESDALEFASSFEEFENISTPQENSKHFKELKYRSTLHNWYKAKHGVSLKLIGDAFLVECLTVVENSSSIGLSTATFQCPINGDRVRSGGGLQGHVPLELDGRFYYRNKTLAMQSAAMEALKRYNVPLEESFDNVPWFNPPYNKLPLLYREDHKIDLTDEMYTVWNKKMAGKSLGGDWWTTSFVCPVSNQVFYFAELPG
jgi:hypothetical protein